jgi:hypothetical protein
MPALTRQKITFGEMRAAGVRGLLVYCSDYKRSVVREFDTSKIHIGAGASLRGTNNKRGRNHRGRS